MFPTLIHRSHGWSNLPQCRISAHACSCHTSTAHVPPASTPFSLSVHVHSLHAHRAPPAALLSHFSSARTTCTHNTRTQCTILPIHFAHRTRARSLLLALPAASSALSSPHVVAFPHPYSSCCWYRDNLSATAAAQGSSCTYCPHTATTLRTKICSNPQQCSTNTTPIPSTQEEL